MVRYINKQRMQKENTERSEDKTITHEKIVMEIG
jgi:hypothetical protein